MTKPAKFDKPCTFETIKDTTYLQLESLETFAAAIGYESVYDLKTDRLLKFIQPKFESVGEAIVSVNRMIAMHNNLAEYIFEEIQINGYHYINDYQGRVYPFTKFIGDKKGKGIDAITALFAGTTKILRKVKMVHSRKEGIIIQSHKVEFNTKRDKAHYGRVVGQ